ncbi:MAG TPA: hypothetical protein VFI28_04555 [Candidatus Limnocylindrales bacterium]|nr:hypothetical protein [Candidatus Limnocylindrales bacterium]
MPDEPGGGAVDPPTVDESDDRRPSRLSGSRLSGSRLSASHPLLFAAYPILFLWSQNLGDVDPADVVLPLALALAAALAATLLLGLVYGSVARAALVVTPLAFGLLMYGHVATAVAPLHVPGAVQQAGWAGLVLLAAVAAGRWRPSRIAAAGTLLTRLGAVLVAITLALIVPFQVAGLGRTAATSADSLPTQTSAPKRDVYWLIFDRYGSDTSEQLMYGVRNDLTPWLRDEGFSVLEGSHANYVRTALSLGATMTMSHLADMPGVPGPGSGDLTFVNDKIADSLVARQFKALGYRYVSIGSWWAPTQRAPLADTDLHLGGPSEFVSTLLDESALPAVQKRLHLAEPVDARVRHFDNNQFGLAALKDERDDDAGPKFVFAHILLPHPPLVYDRDGSFMTSQQVAGLTDLDRYERQLAFTNDQLRQILSGLLSLPPDRQPIIILQGDEGPWPKAYSANYREPFDWSAMSDDLLEIKFGILNAWYVPGGKDIGLSPTMTSINTFPTLFANWFGLPYERRDDRVYTSKSWLQPYDLTDVTDRLTPGG